MKFAYVFSLLIVSLAVCGCGQQVVPDQKEDKSKAYIKPGQKVNDVQVNIDK